MSETGLGPSLDSGPSSYLIHPSAWGRVFSEVRVYGVLEWWSPALYRLGLAASV